MQAKAFSLPALDRSSGLTASSVLSVLLASSIQSSLFDSNVITGSNTTLNCRFARGNLPLLATPTSWLQAFQRRAWKHPHLRLQELSSSLARRRERQRIPTIFSSPVRTRLRRVISVVLNGRPSTRQVLSPSSPRTGTVLRPNRRSLMPLARSSSML